MTKLIWCMALVATSLGCYRYPKFRYRDRIRVLEPTDEMEFNRCQLTGWIVADGGSGVYRVWLECEGPSNLTWVDAHRLALMLEGAP